MNEDNVNIIKAFYYLIKKNVITIYLNKILIHLFLVYLDSNRITPI